MIAYFRYFVFLFWLVMSLFIITPLCLLRPLNSKNGKAFFKTFAWLMDHFGGMTIHTKNKNIVEENHPSVLIGNHQHNFDVLTVAGLASNWTVILGKFELGLIPYFGQIYVLCGNVLIKRGNRKQAMKSMKVLEKKILEKELTVLVFPEGTRNPEKGLLPFKKGAFFTAVRSQTPLIPFAISDFTNQYNLNSFSRIHVYTSAYPPIPTTGLTSKDIPMLIDKSRKIIEDGIEDLNKNYL
jgi:1-acyl-sn-glycerol-3-phosphate acyltransferase